VARFGWADLAERVLETVRPGEALSFRPPAWIERGREDAIVVSSGIQLLVFEGVGASRDVLAHLLDARVWVQTDQAEIDRRNKARGGGEDWLKEELPWTAVHRPSEHADLVVDGSRCFPTILKSRLSSPMVRSEKVLRLVPPSSGTRQFG
jgi:hypothetical protein